MTNRSRRRVLPLESVVALCLVLLQLVSILHFALVPHRFGAGLSSLVHLARERTAEPQATRVQPRSATQAAADCPALVAQSAGCEPDACPLAFSGPPSRHVPPSQLSFLIWLSEASEQEGQEHFAIDRGRALLSAPKTSPPLTV